MNKFTVFLMKGKTTSMVEFIPYIDILIKINVISK